MKKFHKIASLALALVMASMCFTACGDTAKEGESGSGTIKIGGIGPLTGSTQIYGNAVKNGAEIAVDEINAKGGLQFELKFEDDENDPEKATNAYNTLKDWGMQISLGAVTTQPCIAVSSLTNEDHMFALTPSGSSTDIIGGQPDADGNVTIPRKDNMFQMCFTDPNQGTKAAEYINQQKLGSKIAIIYDMSDACSSGIYNKFKAEADKLNLEIVYEGTFTADSATDFTSQLNGAKNAQADLVFLPIYYQPASLILDQANKMNYAPKWFGVDGMDGILTLENFDTSLAEGVMLLTPFSADAEDEKTQNFVKKYQEKCDGQIPNQFAADAYDCIYALYDACTKAGVTADMDASEICDKLIDQFTADDFSMDGLTGIGITWSDTGEVNKEPRGMVIQNGVYVGMD